MKPDELNPQSCDIIRIIPFDGTNAFIKEELKNSIWLSRIAELFYISFVFALVFYLSKSLPFSEPFYSTDIAVFFLGVATTLVLIPIHEVVHAIALKSTGAESISYGMNLKSLTFWALADRHVVSSNQLRYIVLAPLVSISIVLLLSLFYLPPSWKPALIGTLLFHSICCIGDLSFCSFISRHNKARLFYYDDQSKKEAYFLSFKE